VLLNLLRGDLPRLGRCTNIITGEDGALPRVKPFKYTYEKEIVMYAYFKKLDYFSTECIYSPFAARGFAREFVKDLEVLFRPQIPTIRRFTCHLLDGGLSKRLVDLQQTYNQSNAYHGLAGVR